MAIRINYNPMSVLTHASLLKTDRQMSAILERMSSGERIRRSADDPAGMVVANAVRYYRSGVDRAQSNAEEAVTMLQTAEGGMDQITQALQRLRNLALAAKSTATQDPGQLTALQADFDSAVGSITTIATSTTYGSNGLLDGTLRDLSLSDDAKVRYRSLVPDYSKLPGGLQDGSDLTIGAASGNLTRSSTLQAYAPGTLDTATSFAGSGNLTLTGPKGSATLNLQAGATISSVVASINGASAITGIIAGYDSTTGELSLESASYGASTFTVTSGIAGFLVGPTTAAVNRTISLAYTDRLGNPQNVVLTQDPASPDGLTFTNLTGGPEGAAPFTGYTPGAFSLTVRDTSGGGIGATIAPALAGLTANRSGTTAFQIGALSSQRVTVEIPDLRAGALGQSAGLANLGFASLDELVTGQVLINGNATDALTVIDAAIEEVNRARGAAGALQGNTVERVMDSLRQTSVNLAEFEGILRDVDMAKESAEYARVQVMIQAATAMLAQANQVPQTVLQLLK